ncbi:MAG: UDP-N-acetylglucosamine 2-epimerase (hydrolyzing) [Micavibrio sp.]|nr:UDP-N-acetylglucosamine 2-epimerase (hydrolyzing) [Micavibrio sp.]|tara:strand:- start:173 stop:1333 length:1161 start_codon:yes stop_codon:yes gene_type:complete
MKKKICVVVTARPSYSRVRSVLEALRNHEDVELQIVAAASFVANKFGEAVKVLREDGFEPNWTINTLLEADTASTAAKSTGLQTIEMASAFQNLKPDMVLTVADRYETISTAIAASYANIPLVHLQGGEVTGNIDEKVRHAITKMSDIHLVCNDDAYDRVLKLGENPDTVYNVGCPSIDIAKEVLDDRESWEQFTPFKKYVGVGSEIDVDSPYIVVMQHPVTTTIETSRDDILTTLHAVKEIGMPTIVMWPNPDSGTEGTAEGIRRFRELEQPENFYFFKNIRPGDFLRMLLKSKCLIGNSSVGIRECSFLGVPVVNIGTRQLDRKRGSNVIDVPCEQSLIADAVRKQIAHGPYPSEHTYGNGQSGKNAAEILCRVTPNTNKRITY